MKNIALCISLAATTFAFAQPKDSKPAPPPKDAPKDIKKPPPDTKPEPPKKMEPPKPSADLDAAKDFAKAWACTGTMGDAKVSSKFTIKKDLDGFWYSVRLDVPKSKTSPGFVGMGMMGIDAETNAWVMNGFDNHGGMIRMKPSISGTTMTWDGDAIGNGGPQKKVASKMTFTLDDKKKLKFVGEFGGQKAFEYDCK